MPIEQICTLVSAEKLNEFAWSFTLEAGRLVEREAPRPGQFLHVKCGGEHLLRRPISICLAQADEPEDLLRVVFEVRGEGTAWLSRRRAGDRLNVLGPLGSGFSCGGRDRLLLVGGGIGAPPLLGCAARTWGRSTAVLGFRSAERAMLVEDFREKCRDLLLCSDDGSLGRRGFVDGQVRELLERDRVYAAVLACGPKPMLRAVARAAAEHGVPCRVSLEERMACGVGACLGCAVRMADGSMKHVCKDGPVFGAEEVDWDA